MRPPPLPSDSFPSEWLHFMDDFVPNWVKKRYSPRESWTSRPFSKDDAFFFSKGVVELSELFTVERSSRAPLYFRQEKYRSSYMLYYLPLQAAKFVSLFRERNEAMEHALKNPLRADEFSIADLGAGPGTASIAWILWLLNKKKSEWPKKIILEWWDHQETVLKDGRDLLNDFIAESPLQDRIEIRLHAGDWKKARGSWDLLLLGNVLNESTERRGGGASRHFDELEERPPTPSETGPLSELIQSAGAGGVLMIEPALHRQAQNLSRLRDAIIPELLDSEDHPLFGPCLHVGACPLAGGRDWCHFSVPAEVPGRWFQFFSRALGSERQWLKYSYLWWRGKNSYLPTPLPRGARLVLTDSLRRRDSDVGTVLLCEPDHTRRISFSSDMRVGRGQVVMYDGENIRPYIKPLRPGELPPRPEKPAAPFRDERNHGQPRFRDERETGREKKNHSGFREMIFPAAEERDERKRARPNGPRSLSDGEARAEPPSPLRGAAKQDAELRRDAAWKQKHPRKKPAGSLSGASGRSGQAVKTGPRGPKGRK